MMRKKIILACRGIKCAWSGILTTRTPREDSTSATHLAVEVVRNRRVRNFVVYVVVYVAMSHLFSYKFAAALGGPSKLTSFG